MSIAERLLDILFVLTCMAVAFIWGWIMRSIQEKDKKGGEEK